MADENLRYLGNVCISGLTASGKTTHSHLLAGEFGLTYVSGSQIQLNFMGVSPIQTRDFWITEEAKTFWNAEQFNRIDAELLRLEQLSDGYIFDTSTMPWRHKRPSLCIWLGSELDSRVIKSRISHRGRSHFSPTEYRQKIIEKDKSTIELYRSLYSIEIGHDLSPFDLILDISSLVTEPTLHESIHSIGVTHEVIRPAVAWFLTRRDEFLQELRKATNKHQSLIVRNNLLS
jgi:cytidylate kinase